MAIQIAYVSLLIACVAFSGSMAYRNTIIKCKLEYKEYQIRNEQWNVAQYKTYKDKYESLLSQHHAYVESSMATMRSVREMNEQIVALNERIEELRSNEY